MKYSLNGQYLNVEQKTSKKGNNYHLLAVLQGSECQNFMIGQDIDLTKLVAIPQLTNMKFDIFEDGYKNKIVTNYEQMK